MVSKTHSSLGKENDKALIILFNMRLSTQNQYFPTFSQQPRERYSLFDSPTKSFLNIPEPAYQILSLNEGVEDKKTYKLVKHHAFLFC